MSRPRRWLSSSALVGFGGWFLLERDAAPKPADRSEDLGIFAPVAGRIVYVTTSDRGYAWPLGRRPERPVRHDGGAERRRRRRLDAGAAGLEEPSRSAGRATAPSCWSAHRPDQVPQPFLYILHADGSETRLNEDPMCFAERDDLARRVARRLRRRGVVSSTPKAVGRFGSRRRGTSADLLARRDADRVPRRRIDEQTCGWRTRTAATRTRSWRRRAGPGRARPASVVSGGRPHRDRSGPSRPTPWRSTPSPPTARTSRR